MTDEKKQEVALWRFGLISPAVHKTHNFPSDAAFFRSLSDQAFLNPVTGEAKQFSSSTFHYWYWCYSRNGIEGLKPGSRSDEGRTRVLSPEVQKRIFEIAAEHPRFQNTQIRAILADEGILEPGTSQRTIDRFIRKQVLTNKGPASTRGEEVKAFECAKANMVWQADTTEVGKIKGRRVYLMLIIDDASRMAVGWGIFWKDNALNFQKVLKEALMIYGKPQTLYTDNGGPYKNTQLELICADLAIQLAHHGPYQPRKKGKVERLNRTVQNKCFALIDWDKVNDLDEVKERFKNWLHTNYSNSPHSSLKTKENGNLTPRERFLMDSDDIVRPDRDRLDEAFLHQYTRKVRNDSVVQVNGVLYEVPSAYIGETVKLRIDPTDDAKAWFLSPEEKDRKLPLKLLDKIDNSVTPRKQGISYIRKPFEETIQKEKPE